MSPGLNKKLYAAIGALALCLCSIALPFSAHAESVVQAGTRFNRQVSLPLNTDSSQTGVYYDINITPYQPKLLNYDIETTQGNATIQFKTSNGGNFSGSITQSGTAYNTEGSSNISLSFTYTGSGSSQRLYTASGTELASSSGSLTGLNFNNLPTKATITYDDATTTSLYLYECSYLLSIRLTNNEQGIRQITDWATSFSLGFDVNGLVGDSCGFEVQQLDNFSQLGFVGLQTNSKVLQFYPYPDYLYNNRITLPAQSSLFGVFLVSNFYLRTAPTTGQPSVNSLTVNGLSSYRVAPEGTPSPKITWNLQQIFEQLQTLNTAPSNSSSLTDQSSSTQSSIESQHTTEQSYFSQNEANLEATGISNFQFDSNISSGLSSITSDFGALWGAIGQWKFIYVFTLLIGLATFIIRHRSASSGKRKSDKHG